MLMRCFYVLIDGSLTWGSERPGVGDVDRPEGFICFRYVLAASEAKAVEKAFRRVRENLEGWLRDGPAELELHVEEVAPVPMHKLFKRVGGYAFYAEK